MGISSSNSNGYGEGMETYAKYRGSVREYQSPPLPFPLPFLVEKNLWFIRQKIINKLLTPFFNYLCSGKQDKSIAENIFVNLEPWLSKIDRCLNKLVTQSLLNLCRIRISSPSILVPQCSSQSPWLLCHCNIWKTRK